MAVVGVLVVVLVGAGPVGAQDPTAPVTTPAASDPSPGIGPPTAAEPPVVPVPTPDAAAIDRLVAEARAAAVARRDAEIAAAAESVRASEERLGETWSRMGSLQAEAERAAAATDAAEAAVESLRRRISSFAADAYMSVGTDRDEALTQLRGGTDPEVVTAGNDARRTRVYAGKAMAVVKQNRDAEVGRLRAARDVERAAHAAVESVESEVTALAAIAESGRSVEATLRAAPLDVPAAGVIARLSGPDGPTILGPSLLDAADLAAFVRARGVADPSVDVEALAAAFIDEGNAEGVRADLAWAQSVIETGSLGFAGSMVDPGDHNYAGIGACDSCSTGFKYATPQLGARAQIQLLRTYADRSATARSLARPPVGKAPETIGVRGCCSTWMDLSGVWATGPQYGVKILTVYNQMLRFAVDRRVEAEAAAAAVPTAPVPTVPVPAAVPAAPVPAP